MPQGPAARITDNVVHPLPPVLMPGPGSPNVLIGFLPAWRGIPLAAVAGLQAAKAASDAAIKTAEAATLAAAGTPGAPAAYAAEQATKAACLASMTGAITSAAMGADIHACTTPLPVPPHGPGVVIDGSPTVLINNLPACRLGDTILEAIGPPNKIARGEPTVIIGQSGSGASGGGSAGSGAGANVTGDNQQHGYGVPKAGGGAMSAGGSSSSSASGGGGGSAGSGGSGGGSSAAGALARASDNGTAAICDAPT